MAFHAIEKGSRGELANCLGSLLWLLSVEVSLADALKLARDESTHGVSRCPNPKSLRDFLVHQIQWNRCTGAGNSRLRPLHQQLHVSP
jgi:hypothetical protein